MQLEHVYFDHRAYPSHHITQRFEDALPPCLLDVGCDWSLLNKLLPS